jgi:hypothetical protein
MIIALNYGGDERVEFYTYAAVRLFDFYYWYSTPALNSISDSKVLKLDLGEPLGEHQEVNGTYFGTYSNGIVVLNPTNKISRVSIKVPQHLSRLIDIKTMRICEAHNGDLTLEIGPQEGFVLLCEDAIKKENLNPLFLSGWIIIMITITTVIIVFFKKRRCFPQGSRNQKPKTIPSILI